MEGAILTEWQKRKKRNIGQQEKDTGFPMVCKRNAGKETRKSFITVGIKRKLRWKRKHTGGNSKEKKNIWKAARFTCKKDCVLSLFSM